MNDYTTPDDTKEIPYGYCHCGCGQKTPVSKWSDSSHGLKKGEPHPFIKGHRRRIPIKKRFWTKVNILSDDDCWEWTCNRDQKGYGRIRSCDPKCVSAHRMAWILTYGSIPNGMQVLHKCDNPPCCNPKHLFLGTNFDNVQDKVKKGRVAHNGGVRGEKHYLAKLTAENVKEIRKLSGEGIPHISISKRFGISESSVSAIVHRRNWKHIP